MKIKKLTAAPAGWITKYSNGTQVFAFRVAAFAIESTEDGDQFVTFSESGESSTGETDQSAENYLGLYFVPESLTLTRQYELKQPAPIVATDRRDSVDRRVDCSGRDYYRVRRMSQRRGFRVENRERRKISLGILCSLARRKGEKHEH